MRPLMGPDCTVHWLGLYEVNEEGEGGRRRREDFLETVRQVYEEF